MTIWLFVLLDIFTRRKVSVCLSLKAPKDSMKFIWWRKEKTRFDFDLSSFSSWNFPIGQWCWDAGAERTSGLTVNREESNAETCELIASENSSWSRRFSFSLFTIGWVELLCVEFFKLKLESSLGWRWSRVPWDRDCRESNANGSGFDGVRNELFNEILTTERWRSCSMEFSFSKTRTNFTNFCLLFVVTWCLFLLRWFCFFFGFSSSKRWIKSLVAKRFRAGWSPKIRANFLLAMNKWLLAKSFRR